VLERSLPEVAAAMARRRADLGDLDPTAALRFPVVERLDALAHELGLASEELVIAALTADVCGDADEEGSCALALARRLVSADEADRIAAIVADAHLLRAGTREPISLARHEVLQLATHLATVDHARDAYELALAIGSLQRWQREALDERFRLVAEALTHPEVTSSEADNLAAVRRIAAEHLLDDPAVIERLRFASNSYLLAHEPEELARQARLVEPLPRHGAVRVAVAPEPEPDHWKVDVACRDTDGLLARLTDVLRDQGVDIAQATIATWPDGAVLDTFVVRATKRPGAKELADAFEARLRRPIAAQPMPDLQLAFDNEAQPWHTTVVVTGPDRPGALSAVSSAFAAAKVVVHTARIASDASGVHDRFAVSDHVGRKLDADAMERVRRALSGERSRRRFARR